MHTLGKPRPIRTSSDVVYGICRGLPSGVSRSYDLILDNGPPLRKSNELSFEKSLPLMGIDLQTSSMYTCIFILSTILASSGDRCGLLLQNIYVSNDALGSLVISTTVSGEDFKQPPMHPTIIFPVRKQLPPVAQITQACSAPILVGSEKRETTTYGNG